MKPKCWIGWSKQKTPYPLIALLLTKETVVYGLYFHIYINENMGAYTSNEITHQPRTKLEEKCVHQRVITTYRLKGKILN